MPTKKEKGRKPQKDQGKTLRRRKREETPKGVGSDIGCLISHTLAVLTRREISAATVKARRVAKDLPGYREQKNRKREVRKKSPSGIT